MKNLFYYKSLPKVDAHNHLNLGMRYRSYVAWSGIPIPDFPRPMAGLDDMHDVISVYTRPRCRTAEDVRSLISMALMDAKKDGVTILEGSIDIGFLVHFNGNVDAFLQMITSFVSSYAGHMDVRPELGLGKTFDKKLINKWVPSLLDSGVFKSIDLYGPEIEDGIHDFKKIFTSAARHGIKKKAHVGEFSDAKSVKRFVEFFDLDEVQHGIGAAADDKVLRFLADRRVRCNVCPRSNVMLGAVTSLKTHPIGKMVEAGVPVTIGTDDRLFFDHGVSRQARDLVAAGVLSETQAEAVLTTGL